MDCIALTTVCTKCAHFQNLDPGSDRRHVWYNHVCRASPLPKRVDPYDGKVKSFGVNDLGGKYVSEHGLRYCRDVNDGKCPKFKPV